MALTKEKENLYIQILKEELVPALGCTEPIAVAFTAATLKKMIGEMPDKLIIESSGNIIKNAKSVIVPNSGGMKGMTAAAAIGLTGGDCEKELEVLSGVTDADIEAAKTFLSEAEVELKILDTPALLHLKMTAYKGKDCYEAELIHQHTNISLLKKNGEILFEKSSDGGSAKNLTDRTCLNVKEILEFADTVPLELVSGIIQRQIDYNTKIACAGLNERFGISTGQNILKFYQGKGESFSIKLQAEAETAAASDARMCGCPYPVITNSGSGNQGLSVSIPVIVYARELNIGKEKLIRALLVSNLLAIHQKTGIGRLSAYCGAVTAAAASAAAVAYMKGGNYGQICGTVSNTLAGVSGMICDGAKQSCASKIAAALDFALFSHELAMNDLNFSAGDGIVKQNIEETIGGIGVVAAKGMVETDKVILDVMLQ